MSDRATYSEYGRARAARLRLASRRPRTSPDRADRGGRGRSWGAPLQFDESGYPVTQQVPRFAERVRRLLSTQ